jgi:hypothetical protein
LWLALAADHRAGTIDIDRSGRSQFFPDHTLSFWKNPAVCRTISAEDLRTLEQVWSKLAASPGDPWSRQPEKPFLVIDYYTYDQRRVFFIKPTRTGQKPTLETAVAVTLSIAGRTFGDRFFQELRAAGLQDLL